MKLKGSTWLNSKSDSTEYGIKIKIEGKWVNLCRGSNPLIFQTPEERDKEMAQIEAIRAALNP